MIRSRQVISRQQMIDLILSLWLAKSSLREFIIDLEKLGWYCFGHSCKFSFGHADYDFVVKFDDDDSDTRGEHLQWMRAKPSKKRYLARSIVYTHGLLIQQRLDWTCRTNPGCVFCDEAERVAHRLRIADWYNHGSLNGKLKFFDADSMGSGWYNWKRKHNKRLSRNQ